MLPTLPQQPGNTRAARVGSVPPDAAVGCAHVSGSRCAIGEPVAQEHRACRTGRRRFEQGQVGGYRATVEHLLPDAERDRVQPEVEAVEELLAQQGLNKVEAPDNLHMLVSVTNFAHRGSKVGAELGGPGPREVGPATGCYVLRDAVEKGGDVIVLATLLVRPEAGEDVIGSPAE